MNANTQLHLFSSMNHISSQDYRLPKYEILTHTTPPDLPDDPCLTLSPPLPPLLLFPLAEGNREGTVRQEEVSGGEGRGRGGEGGYCRLQTRYHNNHFCQGSRDAFPSCSQERMAEAGERQCNLEMW